MVPGSGNYVVQYKSLELATGVGQFAAPNPARVGLVLWLNGGAGTLYVNPGIAWEPGNGFIIPGTGTVEFWWGRHGPMVQDEWWVNALAGPYTFRWVELLYVG